jgi:hypothetical protein
MRKSAAAVFPMFVAKLLGRHPHMWRDVLGRVLVGVGCSLSSETFARSLPFKHKHTDLPADPDEIGREWSDFEENAAGQTANLYLPEEAANKLFLQRLATAEAGLRCVGHNWPELPANVQLALMLLTWAGPQAPNQHWTDAMKLASSGHWTLCAQSCEDWPLIDQLFLADHSNPDSVAMGLLE